MNPKMNENELKWIPAAGFKLEPFQISLLEKLEKFGWCADFSGFGEGKAEKAMLCAFAAAADREKPNILILCPDRFAQSWYGEALFRLGLEFKLVSGAKDAVSFFSPELSNLFIIGEEVLSDGEAPILAEMRASGLVWDLIIADLSGSADGADLSPYASGIGMKAEKVLLFAPYPAAYSEDPAPVFGIVKAMLNREMTDVPALTPELTRFSMENPCLDYPSEQTGGKVRLIHYEINLKNIPKSLRMEEMQGGGRYTQGGNVFEEYNLEERKIYLRPVYTHTDAEILKNTDAKLKAFLDVIDPIMNSDHQTALVYFGSDATLSYVEKILSAVYFEKKGSVAVFGRTSDIVRRMKQWYEETPAQRPRAVLVKDDLDETFALFSPVTHIINYELPDSPAVLQQRFRRRGMAGGNDPEFILFCDSAGLFDGRVLKKALAGNLYKAFRRGLPSANVLLRVEGIEQILTDMLIDVKYIADYTGAVGSSFDIISRFKSDYNIPSERNLTTAARTHEYSQHKLSVLAAALGVSELVSGKEIDRGALLSAVSAKVSELRGGYACFDEKGTLCTVPAETVKNNEFKQFSRLLSGNPYCTGLKRAREKLKSMSESAGGFAYLKNDMARLSDPIRSAVLYHVWRYWHKELGYGGSYAELIRAYNEGVI